jgi:probable HAF family extracellular repeat protein
MAPVAKRLGSAAAVFVLVAGLGVVAAAGPAGAAAVEPLQALGSFNAPLVVGTIPHGINGTGEVVGEAIDPPSGGEGHFGFSYDPRSMSLHLLARVDTDLGDTVEQALAVNDHGLIVGDSNVAGPFEVGPAQAVEWAPNGQTRILGTIQNRPCTIEDLVCDQSIAYGVNDEGVVVGSSNAQDGTVTHAFVYQPTTRTMTDIGTLPGGSNSVAYGIDDAGLVVGTSEVGGTPTTSHAFTYDVATKVMTDLGTLPGGSNSSAVAINEHGLIAGSSDLPGGAVHPFLYDTATATMTDLGTLAGTTNDSATALNDDGVVVGNESGVDLGVGTGGGGWVYDPGTKTIDPIPESANAAGVSDQGVIIGIGLVPEIIDGQVSDYPEAAYLTSVKLTAPRSPTHLGAVGGCPSGPTLSWSPPSPRPYAATTGYVVYRNGVEIATTTAPTFTDPTATASATYTVAATDAVGTSAPSHPFSWVCPAVVPGTGSVAEGNSGDTILLVPVTLSSPSAQTVTVQWATEDVAGAPGNQADPATDYAPGSGTVTFAPGQTSATVSIVVHGDTQVEPDEYVIVAFSDPAGARIGGFYGLGFGIILNDD